MTILIFGEGHLLSVFRQHRRRNRPADHEPPGRRAVPILRSNGRDRSSKVPSAQDRRPLAPARTKIRSLLLLRLLLVSSFQHFSTQFKILAFQKVRTTSHLVDTASHRTISTNPARTSSSATDAWTRSTAITPRAAPAKSSATDSISSQTTMALRTFSAPTDPAHADETFASAIFSSPKPYLNMRASGTRASILSR